MFTKFCSPFVEEINHLSDNDKFLLEVEFIDLFVHQLWLKINHNDYACDFYAEISINNLLMETESSPIRVVQIIFLYSRRN